MSIAVSPMATDAVSPMITTVTPTVEPRKAEEEEEGRGGELAKESDPAQRYDKPPPLHTGADWKVVLHLPEIETWLRCTADRVRDLTHSVHQDAHNKHVDVHLVQLKDICEDISDHVEQIHALLETEFSLKLLSYSVNIIVDIRTVQLLWHQLRVSVLVLKERVLQGLQDSNGNYTRQTDILQAFSQDQTEARLDALTEVDDSGQLTIKCSQNYLSLDCGITACELSDYSPSEDLPIELEAMEESKATSGKPLLPQGNTEPPGEDLALADNAVMSPIKHQGVPRSRHASHCENSLSKRPIRDCFNYNEVSPTQPSMPKKAMYLEGMSSDDIESIIKRAPPSSLQFKGDMSRSTPSLLDPPDRSKFWLELTSVYPRSAPSAVSQSYDCLNTMSDKIHKALANGPPYKRVQGQAASNPSLQGSTSEAEQPSSLADRPSPPEQLGCAHVVGFQESCNEMKSSPLNVSSPEGSDPTPPDHRKGLSATIPETSAHSPDSKSLPVATKEHLPPTCNGTETKKEPWYGSDEYLALPSQLKKTEMLAMKLENLAKVLPQKPMEETFQDVDDWELSEVNSDCDGYLPLRLTRVSEKPFPGGRLSPTSSSDIAPSLDESIESGPLSDLLSEDEVNAADLSVKQKARDLWLVKDPSQAEETSLGRTALIQQLLDDIQHQENYEDIWEKIEGFVGKLDEFIQWLHEALETTENWTPPKAETTCLKLYLETHLSFKLNVDSHCALKDTVVEEGRQLLEFIVSHKSGLKDMLQMIVNQWQELQRQIRRQHSWILRALEIIKAEILASDVSHEAESGAGSPEGEAQRWHHETQQDVLEQLALKVYSERFSSRTERKREFAEMSKVNRIGSNSLLDFESEYQELWDWLMDMESIVMDSHDLMMSEEQQQHLYKGNSVEMAMWFPRKTQLLSRVESLRRSATSLPADFEDRVSALTQKWDLLEKTLEERTGGPTGAQAGPGPRSLLSPETNGLVRQLESRIKELRGWLRDTELLIFNSCLRQEKAEAGVPHAPRQLQYFKSLCGEIRQRRRGVSSVLRLCQRLLEEQDSSTPDTERQALQLVTVNLERRWEAIVMQALQWQTRLQKRLGTEQVPGNVIEPAFMDLNTSAEDSWEWDETDISNDLIRSRAGDPQFDQYVSQHDSPSCGSGFTPPSSSPRVYQVYSLHDVELYDRPHLPFLGKSPQDSSRKQPNTLMKSLSKDSSFSSTESLPDLLEGVGSVHQGRLACCGDSARRSESESGIVSEGDTETTANSEVCLPNRVDEPSEHVDVSVSCTSRGILQANDQNTPAEKKKRASTDQPSEGHPVAIVLNGQEPLAEGDTEGFKQPPFTRQDDERGCADLKSGKLSAFLSHGSSLDSLSVAGDLFLSGKDTLHRSTSLESWLAPCKSTEEISSQHSLGDLGFGGDSTGELSKRTLELLKRLENIPSPFNHKMKRSISDITLQSSSLKMPASTQLPLEVASSVNEDSAASLTELSSSEDLSLCSEDIAVQKNRIVDSNASFRKHVNHVVPDEADVSISMIVNVSCTSACTDDDDDDSDLLSSSTLTLTEEELGIKDDDDSSIASDEEYIESSFALGLDYMKNELQNWIKPRLSQSKEKNELGDELQCGALSRENITSSFTVNERRFLNRSALKLLEANANDISKVSQEKSRSYMNQFVDDMENGNVENSQLKAKDADDELLREEESLITKSGESLKDCYASDLGTGSSVGVVTGAKSFQCDLLSTQPKESSLECQLSGEIPCCSSDREPSSVLPMSNRQGSHKGTVELTHNDGISDSFAIFRKDTEEISDSIAEVPSCCSHHSPVEEGKNEDDGSVHNFVMEIIDMASVALKNKTLSDPQAPSPTPVAQIRDKVLEHSHRPIQLRKGDFYSYLSLSSHDSDCGEVSTCVEDKSSTPLPPDLGDTLNIRDEELLFKPCTEQVYIGPPLSHSMCMSQRTPKSTGQGHSCHAKPRGSVSSSHQNGTDHAPKPHCTENQKAPGISKGSTARSQLECHNEASYLNPLPCETLIDTVECFSDTKMLESNISPVMTKIRVSCSSTNPLKEEDSLYINPKINCPQIRKFDRDEKGPASQRMKQKHIKKGCSSQQETKSAHKQVGLCIILYNFFK
ncbi:AKAP6 protein, partial [Atractosteus spatula]|nr:AKAP6 protein [Atractosteus spatula]